MDDLTQKAIDAVFGIIEDKNKADKLGDLQNRLNITNDFVSFPSLFDFGNEKLIEFLDWYFYKLFPDFHPKNDLGGGLASYCLYDAATPYIGEKIYNIKNKEEFEKYVTDRLKEEPNDQ